MSGPLEKARERVMAAQAEASRRAADVIGTPAEAQKTCTRCHDRGNACQDLYTYFSLGGPLRCCSRCHGTGKEPAP